MNTPSQNAEYAVIGDFLAGRSPIDYIQESARHVGLDKDKFENPVLGKAFEIAMAFEGANRDFLLKEMVAKGIPFEACEEAAGHTTATLDEMEENLRSVHERFIRDGIERKIREAKEGAVSGYQFGLNISYLVGEFVKANESPGAKTKRSRTAWDFYTSYDPSKSEADRLFEGDQNYWLSRGGSAVVVATSGAGKSIFSSQMILAWAAGRPCFGIRPAKPLKVMYIQSEDPDDVFYRNLGSLEKLSGLDPDEYREAMGNIVFPEFTGSAGEAFVNELAMHQRENECDLIVVNPLHGVMAGMDIKSNADLTKFFRQGIDGIVKGRRAGCKKCAIIFIHHTNKPPSQQSGAYGIGSSQYLEYVGAGGAELTNWARAILVMQPETGRMKRDGHYNIIAAKNGAWLGWSDTLDGRPAWCVRHHSPELDGGGKLVYWHDAEPLCASKPTPAAKPEVPLEEQAQSLAETIKGMPRPPTSTEAREKAEAIFGRARGRKVFGLIKDSPGNYGLGYIPGASPAQKLIAEVPNRFGASLLQN